MHEKKSLKLLNWTKSDVAKVCAIYVVNLLILAMLFIGMAYVGSFTGGKKLIEYFSGTPIFLDFMMLLVLLIFVMAFYFYFEERNFLHNPANSEMLFLIFEIALIINYTSGKYIFIYIRPLALVALLTLFLTNSRTAIFMSFIFSMTTFLFDSFAGIYVGVSKYSHVYFLAMGISSSALAVYLLKNTYSRLKLFLMSFLISVPVLVCVAVPVISFVSDDLIKSLVSALISGPFTAILFITILPFFEGVFKKASFFKFAELTDHNTRLLKNLISKAPGTFNHSIVVSNIAEACATAIEEDAMLARTCAYYHDIGKIRRPEFFKENQADGVNPHDDLTPELSANIIKSHAADGYQLLMKHRLPEVIADVCAQHHGTLPILYFYDKAKKFTDGEVDLSQYCYPGPKPQSKIAAIIMIADGCEAAARSLQDRSRENVYAVVKKIVSDRMALGQFDECEITLKELNIIINTVVNSLTGVYHNRIEYPKMSLEEIEHEEVVEETEKEEV